MFPQDFVKKQGIAFAKVSPPKCCKTSQGMTFVKVSKPRCCKKVEGKRGQLQVKSY